MPPIKNTAIGITFPIRDGKSGYFEQSTDTFTAYSMNIINLLRTIPGERRLNPTFGCGLWTTVFEPNDEMLVQKVQSIIKNDIAQWIPGVTVSSVQVNTNSSGTNLVDVYQLYIIVTYVVNAINTSNSVQLTLNINKV